MRVQPPLVWPPLPQWPSTLSSAERQLHQTFFANLPSSTANNADTHLLFQLPPTPVSLALSIYEPDPLRSPNSKDGLDFGQHFLVQRHLSGPKKLKYTLLPDVVQLMLNEPLTNLDSSFLFQHDLDEILQQHVDNLTAPKAKPKSTATSANPHTGTHRSRSRGATSTNTNWQTSNQRSYDSRDTWQQSYQRSSESSETWQRSWWQPKEWSSSSNDWHR